MPPLCPLRLRFTHRIFTLAVIFAWLAPMSCAPKRPISGFVPTPAAPPSRTDFQVGAARVDLTPIPGIGMNYSLDGYLSRGFWTRLFARAIYIEDKKDNTIVLVSSDLPHIPNGLGDRVAENLSKLVGTDRLDHLDGAQIILAATHTHHGPENWFSSKLYNAFPSPKPGFDPQLFDFIAERITSAIHQAYENRTQVSKVEIRQARLSHFFRNRSLEAFLRNGDSGAFLSNNAAVPSDCLLPEGGTDERACRAVRSEVEVVEFQDSAGGRIASAVFLAAHPTVLSKETEVFSGDLFGAAASLVEQERVDGCDGYGAPVVAFFNGAQGDVSPTWREKFRNRFALLNEDPAQDLGLAVRLARFVCNKEPVAVPTVIEHESLATRFSWLDLQEPRSARKDPLTSSEYGCDPRHQSCTEVAPLSGIPSAGGAQDGRTFFYEVGMREGLRSDDRMQHGRKVLGIEGLGTVIPLAAVLSSADSAPNKVPLGIYQIGNLALVPLPGEFTTMMGQRIRNDVTQALVAAADDTSQKQHVLLIGLANGHVSYVTTPEEYDAQFYEGAQNLYGAATGPLIQNEIEKLVTSSKPGTRVAGGDYSYDTGECRVFLPRDAGLPPFSADDGLQNILMDLSQPEVTKRDFDQLCWVDAIPALPKAGKSYDDSAEMCQRPVPYVWIEKTSAPQCSPLPGDFLDGPCDTRKAGASKNCTTGDPRHCIDGVPQDNCGLDVVTVLHGSYQDRTRWCAFWMPRPAQTASDFKVCVAGVTDDAVQIVDSHAPLGEFDNGYVDLWRWFQPLASLWKDHHECSGCRTRPVCEMPE